MAEVLVAEDSQTQAVRIKAVLEKAGHSVRVAVDGNEALIAIEQAAPDILLTDMHMPGRNGLELTERIRKFLPDVPVVLMTSDGNEDLAVKALRKGASNYISKQWLARDLVPVIDGIATMLESRRSRSSVLSALTHAEATYTFGNDRNFASLLVSQFESDLKAVAYDDETGLFRIVTALKEAIVNAIDHGNLELCSDMKDQGNGEEFDKLAQQRLTEEPYCYRQVTVTSRVSPEQLAYIIRDEGPGFDPASLPDPEDPENILRSHGRGLLLIRSFMDDVIFNEKGNQITLIKYRVDPNLDTSDAPPLLQNKRQLKILMAEDSVTNQVLAKSLLEREGHTVCVAQNGAEAVAISETELFDLILMDLEMPQLDGVSATQQIRTREASTGLFVPILALTASHGDHDIQRCLNAGMQGHIPKPVRAELLNLALERI